MAGNRIIVFALLALAALALALSARGGVEAQYLPSNTYSLTSTVPGANSNSVVGFSIAAPDYNVTGFSIWAPDYSYEDVSMTTLLPPDAWTANGLEAPIGAKAGTLNASIAVGILGTPCSVVANPYFTLYNASVDIAAPDYSTIDWILLNGSGYPPPDTDGDGLWNYLEQYPQFLNTMLDPDGSGPLLPLQPRARLAGNTTVAGFNVLVQVLVFNPGQMTQLGGIYAQMTAEKGAPSLIVLNDPLGEREARPGPISDFCTPLSTTTTLYATTQDNPATLTINEAGYTRQANPAANTGMLGTGTHVAWNYSQSERNVDGDPFENDLDACRYTTDIAGWNPRAGFPYSCALAPPGDNDCDMLPSSCDPNDNQKNTDQDNDGYDNAQDNCPLVQNGCQDAPCGPIWNPLWDNQADRDAGLTNTDLGPRSDAIGDACDDSDDDGNEDGAGAGTCNDGIDNGPDGTTDGNDPDCTASMDSVDWPPTTADPQNGTYYHAYPWTAACVGAVDSDGDGYCDALEIALGSPANNGYETGAQCNNAIDDDGDGYVNDGCPRVGSYSETGAQCAPGNAVSDDTPTPDTWETPAVVNDGCPVIGVPESLVIDATMDAASALPSRKAPQSCSDGVDNDNDGTVDAADGGMMGCVAGYYVNDADKDGVPNDGTDNCPSVWNPTQTNTDVALQAAGASVVGDAQGDVCDSDDDNDGFSDAVEAHLPTDPLDNCSNSQTQAAGTFRSDAWPLDMNRDGAVTVPGDALQYAGYLGAEVSGNPPASWIISRLDLNGDLAITVPGDVLKYAGRLGSECE